jgi:hypothetical protein
LFAVDRLPQKGEQRERKKNNNPLLLRDCLLPSPTFLLPPRSDAASELSLEIGLEEEEEEKKNCG